AGTGAALPGGRYTSTRSGCPSLAGMDSSSTAMPGGAGARGGNMPRMASRTPGSASVVSVMGGKVSRRDNSSGSTRCFDDIARFLVVVFIGVSQTAVGRREKTSGDWVAAEAARSDGIRAQATQAGRRGLRYH